MNVAILLPANPEQENGITLRGKSICDIIKREHNVILIYSNNTKFDNVYRLAIEMLIWNIVLVKRLLKIKIDYIYCCSDYWGFIAVYFISKLYDIPIIFEAHGIISEENISKGGPYIITKLSQFMERFAIRNSRFVIALSKNILDYFEAFNKNVFLIPVFLNIDSYRSGPKSILSKYMGIIGPFDMPANKHFLEFIYNNLENFNKKIKILIIGKCNNKIQNERLIYTGYIESRAEYITCLSQLDCVLVPSNVQTSGPLNKILEPMACSIPVFTTPDGYVGLDNIQPGKHIFVLSEKDLVQQINNIIFDEELLKEVGQNARKAIEQYYNESIQGNKILDIINDI